MKILQVIPYYHPATRYGGPAIAVQGLSAALAARGHEVHVYTTNADGAGAAGVPLEKPVQMDGVSIHYFPVSRLRRLFHAPAMQGVLRARIRDYDLVHLHTVFLWPTYAAARTAHAAGIPYVISPHGMLVRELVKARSRWAKTAWIALVERQTFARAAGVHVASQVEAQAFAEFGLADALRVFQVAHGVTMADDVSTEAPGTAAVPYVLVLGRISWKKRIELAIAAIARTTGVELVVAGYDDEGLVPELSQAARDAGVADRVRFTGPVDGEAKGQLVRNAVALLMTSHSENFGLVVLEALALGTPAIVVPGIGAAEIVTQAQGGLLVQAEAGGIANAITSLVADPAMRARMSTSAVAWTRANSAWPALAAAMEQHYRRLLDAQTAGLEQGTA